MPITQNSAANAYYYNSSVSNNNKTNSNSVLPVFDYHKVTNIFECASEIDKNMRIRYG